MEPYHWYGRYGVVASEHCLPVAKPRIYDGALYETIDERIYQSIGMHIVPTNDSNLPVAPNFFVEGDTESGRGVLMKLQACHSGALGARAIHSLFNYQKSDPLVDDTMKSFSATYHYGLAQLFGIVVGPSRMPDKLLEYHMIQIGAYVMTNGPDGFREGATAFRNLREVAESYRTIGIGVANRVAGQ